jgi:hypothetical protein
MTLLLDAGVPQCPPSRIDVCRGHVNCIGGADMSSEARCRASIRLETTLEFGAHIFNL